MVRKIGWLIGTAALALGITNPVSGQETSSEKGEALVFNPRKLMTPRPAIVNAPFLRVNEVTGEVTDSELVIGMVVNKQARAYPINQLTGPSREIINDALGGRDIAATW